MKLSESKLFAIEALNSIENLEWPEWAQFVEVDVGNKVAAFKSLIDGKAAHMHGINIPSSNYYGASFTVNVTKEEFDSVSTAPAHSIESLISQHKAARLSTLEARRQLEQAEAAEHSLLLSIEVWAESHGFDIRLMDEAKEKPELVITDWRDLRVGDVIECVIPDGGAIECGDLGVVSGFDDCSVIANFADQCGYQYKATSLGAYFKFIRRPAK